MSAHLSTIIRIIKQIVKYLIILKASLFRLSCCCCCFCILYLICSFWRIYRRRHCRLWFAFFVFFLDLLHYKLMSCLFSPHTNTQRLWHREWKKHSKKKTPHWEWRALWTNIECVRCSIYISENSRLWITVCYCGALKGVEIPILCYQHVILMPLIYSNAESARRKLLKIYDFLQQDFAYCIIPYFVFNAIRNTRYI